MYDSEYNEVKKIDLIWIKFSCIEKKLENMFRLDILIEIIKI